MQQGPLVLVLVSPLRIYRRHRWQARLERRRQRRSVLRDLTGRIREPGLEVAQQRPVALRLLPVLPLQEAWPSVVVPEERLSEAVAVRQGSCRRTKLLPAVPFRVAPVSSPEQWVPMQLVFRNLPFRRMRTIHYRMCWLLEPNRTTRSLVLRVRPGRVRQEQAVPRVSFPIHLRHHVCSNSNHCQRHRR